MGDSTAWVIWVNRAMQHWLHSFRSRAVYWHVLALWGFACAQPLYDLFAQYPTFLVAHGLTGNALFVFAAVLSLLLPLTLVALLGLLQHLHRTLAASVAAVILLLLVFLFLCPLPWSVWPELPTGFGLAIAGVGALGALAIYTRSIRFREGLTFLAIAVLAFPLLFFTAATLNPLLDRNGEVGDAYAAVPLRDEPGAESPHLMMLVFDELPLTALMNGLGEIDRERFPNFAHLADMADVYSATTTVAARTQAAVPALLTGRLPTVAAQTPDATTHPQNLFSLLRRRYELDVFESITALCEGISCRHAPLLWRQVLADSAVVLAHRVTPPALRKKLPGIAQNWTGFVGDSADKNPTLAQAARLERFIAAIGERVGPETRPRLSFFHSVLPHAPYLLLPAGERLFRHRITSGYLLEGNVDRLSDADYAATESLAFFDWQLGYVDTQLGRLLERLRETDLLDRTLLVVTADHGVSLQRGQPRREPTADTLLDILSVPLFIKRPAQSVPRQFSHPMQTIDIVPTLLAELGLRAPEALDGLAYGGRGAAAADYARSLVHGSEISHPPNALAELGGQSWWPEKPAIDDQLLPTTLELNGVTCGFADQLVLQQPQLYNAVRSESFLPAHMLLAGTKGLAAPVFVRFNGVVHDTQATGPNDVSAFLDPRLFVEGHNRVEVISRSDDGWCLVYQNLGAANAPG